MPTRKYAIKGIVQGYTGSQLQDDIKKLAGLRKETIVKEKTVVEYAEDVTLLIVGKACAAVMPDVDTSLKKLFVKLKKLLPDEVVRSVTRVDPDTKLEYQDDVSDLHYKMGPLKKNSRIAQKAVHYAVCDKQNYATPQLQLVRDILRATMVFPPNAWGSKVDLIGAKMIDTVNDHFGGQVVQVKNRFIHSRYPNFNGLNGFKLPKDLDEYIDANFKETLWGRDSFYRDLQLLIRIDSDTFPNGQDMTHTILELQLASSKMYSGKTDKKAKGGSGHDMYKNVRTVMEYCEYVWWKNYHKDNVKLPSAAKYYDYNGITFDTFIKNAIAMADLYRSKDVMGMAGVLGDAIDDSEWMKALVKRGGNLS